MILELITRLKIINSNRITQIYIPMNTTEERIKKLREAKQQLAELTETINELESMQPEPEQGMTWERAFDIVKPRYWPNATGVSEGGSMLPTVCNTNIPTEADAKAVIAFCKLIVIAAACNHGKAVGKERYGVELSTGKLSSHIYENFKGLIEFYSESDRNQSMITNRQLWLDLYKKS